MSSIGAVYLSTDFRLRAGEAQDFIATWQALTGWAMGEGYLVNSLLIQDEAEPLHFRGVSQWINEEARDASFTGSPEAVELMRRLTSMCEAIDLGRYTLRATSIGLNY